MKQALKAKVNDDNNNNIIYDNRSTSSETDCSSLSSSDKENDSRPSSSLYGNINKKSESQKKNPGESFQYRTMNGSVIKSVVPPGKGIKVDYKVSRFTCFCSVCFSSRSYQNACAIFLRVVKLQGVKYLLSELFLHRHHRTSQHRSRSLTLKLPQALVVHH